MRLRPVLHHNCHSLVRTTHLRNPHSSLRSIWSIRRGLSSTQTVLQSARHPHPPPARITSPPLQSSLSATVVAIGFLASVSFTIAYNHYVDYQKAKDLEDDSEGAEDPEDPELPDYTDVAKTEEIRAIPVGASYFEHMAQYETKQGWPGNLTPEQEAKLRQLWWQLGQLVGITEGRPSLDRANSFDSSASPQSHKKSKLGFLKGKSSSASSNDATATDKYGQKEDYLHAIAEQSPEQMRRTIWGFMKADEPDALLCRFLRARKWDVNKALVMLISTVRWRGKITHLDDEIVKKGEEHFADLAAHGAGLDKAIGEGFMWQYRHGKSWLHGVDKQGRPICCVHVRLHKASDQTYQSLEQFTIFSIETARMMLRPPIDTALVIFDMTGFGLSNMDYNPVKFMIKIFEANYPESLGAICVHRAPWVFNSIWNVIKGMLDPVVASKIHFTKDVNELAQFIDRDKIPKVLGGDEPWEFKYIEPIPGENKIMEDTATHDALQAERWGYVEQYEAATLDWAASEGKDEKAQAKRMALYEKMRVNYWKLDPYVRARTYFDRVGTLQPGGIYDPYPKHPPEYYMKKMTEAPTAGEQTEKHIARINKIDPVRRMSAISTVSGNEQFYDAHEVQPVH